MFLKHNVNQNTNNENTNTCKYKNNYENKQATLVKTSFLKFFCKVKQDAIGKQLKYKIVLASVCKQMCCKTCHLHSPTILLLVLPLFKESFYN